MRTLLGSEPSPRWAPIDLTATVLSWLPQREAGRAQTGVGSLVGEECFREFLARGTRGEVVRTSLPPSSRCRSSAAEPRRGHRIDSPIRLNQHPWSLAQEWVLNRFKTPLCQLIKADGSFPAERDRWEDPRRPTDTFLGFQSPSAGIRPCRLLKSRCWGLRMGWVAQTGHFIGAPAN